MPGFSMRTYIFEPRGIVHDPIRGPMWAEAPTMLMPPSLFGMAPTRPLMPVPQEGQETGTYALCSTRAQDVRLYEL